MYLVTLILLIVTFLILHKTDEKLNILRWITISIVCLLCYNVLIVYVLNVFHILSTLNILSIINLVISAIIVFYVFKTKKVQKYYIKIQELICIILIILITSIVSIRYFGWPFDLKYVMTDAAVHYSAALQFYDKSDLLNNVENPFNNFKTMMPGAYVNTGTLFKVFDGIIDRIDFYKIFIFFDIFLLALSAIMIYMSLSKFAKNWRIELCAFIVTLIYALGYPANSMMFGFTYLILSIIIINCIITLMEYFKEDKLQKFQLVFLLFLLTFGLFFSYYLFVPVIYGAMVIFFCIESYKKNKSIFNKNNILNISTMLVLPFIFGAVYHILPMLVKTGPEYVKSMLQLTGYIYENLWSNFILFVPIAIIGFFKEKNIFNKLTIIFLLVFIDILIVVAKGMETETYYLFKNYFVLWLVIIYIFFKGLIFIDTKNKFIPIIFLIVYATILIVSVTKFENKNLTAVMDIFSTNNQTITERVPVYNQSELEIIRYVSQNIKLDEKVRVMIAPTQAYWFYAIFEHTNVKGTGELLYKLRSLPERYKVENYDYIIYFNRTVRLDEETIFKDMKYIMQNENGGVLKRISVYDNEEKYKEI